ncbi:MAG: hypothetical protein HY741_04290 [Chloroflexi bacterium]|nr:hypothetical protein [Chloroflexota bacterium]
MKLPNAERAIIAQDKLVEYLLNVEHERGGSKAHVLYEFGYRRENWERLADDIRKFHLNAQIQVVRESMYGTRYEISAMLVTPSGRSLKVRTIWQVDKGTDYPRRITLFPD